MDYSLSISPGISPAARHKLEDKLDDFLAKFDGETTGGGTMLDGSGSDLDFECGESGFEDELKAFLLTNANINATIRLLELEGMQELFSIECQQKKWWKLW